MAHRRYRRNARRSSARAGIPTWLLLAGGGFVAYFLITKMSSAAAAAIQRPPAAPTGPTVNIGGQNIPVTQVATAVTNAVDKVIAGIGGSAPAAPADDSWKSSLVTSV